MSTPEIQFPRWFVRLCAAASLVWFLALAYQMAVGLWWSAANQIISEQHQVEVKDLKDQIELLKLRCNRLERDYAVLLDRNERNGQP